MVSSPTTTFVTHVVVFNVYPKRFSKVLLETTNSKLLSEYNSIKTYDYLTLFSFNYPRLDFLMSSVASVSRKAEDAYPGAPGPCS